MVCRVQIVFIVKQVSKKKVQKRDAMRNLAAVEVISGNNIGATRCIHISGAVNRIITAPDACAGTGRLNKFDVMIVSSASASLWISLASVTTARVVLTACIAWVQLLGSFGPNATSELDILLSILPITTL